MVLPFFRRDMVLYLVGTLPCKVGQAQVVAQVLLPFVRGQVTAVPTAGPCWFVVATVPAVEVMFRCVEALEALDAVADQPWSLVAQVPQMAAV